MRVWDLLYREGRGFVFVRFMAKAPERTMIAANLKIVWMLKIMERAPAATAPRAAPTLNIVDR